MQTHRISLRPETATAAAAAKSLQSCPTQCDPRDGSPPGSPVPGILQARTLEWVAISFSNAEKRKVKSESEVAQSCPTLCDPRDGSPPGSPVPRILQARTLECSSGFTKTFLYFIKTLLSHLRTPSNPPCKNKTDRWTKKGLPLEKKQSASSYPALI